MKRKGRWQSPFRRLFLLGSHKDEKRRKPVRSGSLRRFEEKLEDVSEAKGKSIAKGLGGGEIAHVQPESGELQARSGHHAGAQHVIPFQGRREALKLGTL